MLRMSAVWSGMMRGAPAGWRRWVYLVALGLVAAPVIAIAWAFLLLFIVIGLLMAIAGGPEEREKRRLRRVYAEQVRVISRQEAWARVRAGRGTFLAFVHGWGLQSLWWVEAERAQLDSNAQLPISPTFGFADGELLERIEPYMVRALKVEGMERWEFEELNEVPTVQIGVGLNEAGLTGWEWVDGAMERMRVVTRGEDDLAESRAKKSRGMG